jgi:hypothetical protein
MNILQQEDIIKGLPDDALMQEAQAPSGQVPQFLVVSEVQRRADMRKRYQEQQQPQGTVAEQIVGEAQQGIAAMQQQGGPMPPQAMPPQGMPPQGMPPQGMPPQGMPPQQMFGGGIIRLQGGGFLDQQTVSGAGTVKSQIDQAIASGATAADLLSIFKNQPDAIQYIQQITGGKVAADMTADKVGSQFNYFQPPEFLGDAVQAGIGAMEKIPSEQDMVDFYRGILPEAPERGAAEAAGRQFGERVRGGVADLFSGGNRSVVDPSRRGTGAKRGGAEPQGSGGQMSRNSGVERQGSSSIQRQSINDATESLTPDSYVSPHQDQIAALYDQYAGQEPTVPELSRAIDLAQDNLNDASSKGFSTASSPSLDLSDLIADSKRMSQANALMQLGAGIAGGDLSKGLSAAGTAASRGAQDARKIAISQRLAEYNAGREDLSRKEKTRQFDAQLDVMKDRVKAYERAGVAGVDSATIRATQAELQSLRETFGIDPKDPRILALESRLFQLLNVDPNSAPTVTQGQSTAGYRVVRGQAQG